jgi:xylulose-5-phosphate/fructose-6-phosphate phosphoketolase
MARLFRQFSFPGGIPSHAAPETPGSIHEGGELGSSLAHAYGAVFDNPDLIAACVVGDGEAETGPAAAGWHSDKFHNPVTDGAVLPILHLNGYKIAGPTVLARIPDAELDALFEGYGYHVYRVTGDDPDRVHQELAATMDAVTGEITGIWRRARDEGDTARPAWPMIILKTPKGWTGPETVDGLQVEGTWRAHQVPVPDARGNPAHLRQLEEWMRGYRPEELFDDNGRCGRNSPRWRPVHTAGWARTRTPTAGYCCATCACPISAPTRCRSPSRAPGWPRAPGRWEPGGGTSSGAIPARSGCSARTRPPPTGCRTCSRPPIAPSTPGSFPATTISPRTGG